MGLPVLDEKAEYEQLTRPGLRGFDALVCAVRRRDASHEAGPGVPVCHGTGVGGTGLLPGLRKLAPRRITTTEQVGPAMIAVARGGAGGRVLETEGINRAAVG